MGYKVYINITCSILSSLIFIGCGVYTFSGHGIGGIKTIAVEPFDDKTAEFGIRDDLSDAVVTRLLNDRTLTLTSQSNADAILSGTITGISDLPLTYDENEQIQEYQIRINVDVVLRKRGQTEAIWQTRITGEGNYPYKTGGAEERQQGIDRAIELLVQNLINGLTSDW